MRKIKPIAFGVNLLLAGTLAGCGGGGDYREVSDQDLKPVEEHEHHHAAPHGGLLIEVGEHEYNVELVVSNSDPRLLVYVLDAHAEGPVAVKVDAIKLVLEAGETPTDIVLKPLPQPGEAEGMASQFQIEGALPEAVKTSQDLHGDLMLTVGEKTYTTHVAEEGHDHDHDHDHDHE